MRSLSLALCTLALASCIPPDPVDDDRTADGATGTVRVRTRTGETAMTYTVRGGRAVVEDDLDLGAIDEILHDRGGAVNAAQLWYGGDVHYAFDPSVSAAAQATITAVMNELAESTPLDVHLETRATAATSS